MVSCVADFSYYYYLLMPNKLINERDGKSDLVTRKLYML